MWTFEEINKLDDVYTSTTSLKDFLIKSNGMKNRSSLVNFYYDRKKNINHIKIKVRNPPSPTEHVNIQPESVESPSDIKITETGSADNDLKNIYKNMVERQETKENTRRSDSPPADNKTDSYKINLKSPLAVLAETINNKLLYGSNGIIGGNRVLDSNELEFIDKSSRGVIAELDNIDDPKLNYMFYSYLVPAIGRVDLYIDRIIRMSKPKSKNQTNINTPPVTHEPSEVEFSVNSDKSSDLNYNASQMQQIAGWKIQNFNIDPHFDFNVGIDIVAYRDMKIVRNIGSVFGG